MSNRYKVYDQTVMYYMTLSVVGWIDIFTRQRYRDIVPEEIDFATI